MKLIRISKRASICYFKTRAIMHECMTRRHFQKLPILKLLKIDAYYPALRRLCISNQQEIVSKNQRKKSQNKTQ